MIEEKTQILCIRIPSGLKELLDAEATKKNITVSELARQYIDTGLSLDGFKANIDMITEMLDTAVSSALEPQVNRLVKLLMKIGKINGAGYYIQLANLMNARDKTSISDTAEVVRNCNRLALDYMNQKDSDIERFLMNNMELVKKAVGLKITTFADTTDIPDF